MRDQFFSLPTLPRGNPQATILFSSGHGPEGPSACPSHAVARAPRAQRTARRDGAGTGGENNLRSPRSEKTLFFHFPRIPLRKAARLAAHPAAHAVCTPLNFFC